MLEISDKNNIMKKITMKARPARRQTGPATMNNGKKNPSIIP